MSSIYKAVATVCFVALWGLHTASAEDPYLYEVITEDVSEEAYLAANLVRNGKLPVHIGNVVKDESLVTTLKRADQGAPAFIEGPCNEVTVKAGGLEMFHHIFDYHANPDYRQLLQAALDAGLEAFKDKAYPKTDEEWRQIWANGAGASLAHLLGSTSTTIGCVIGKCSEVKGVPDEEEQPNDSEEHQRETQTSKAVLFCQLRPAATKDKAPFDEDYFKGLTARTTALADMTENDLIPPVGGGTAAVATPTILIAGLVAMLTAMSA